MSRAIDRIIERTSLELPDVVVSQLECRSAADDDGLWFFRHTKTGHEVQLESSKGEFPFLAEFTGSTERINISNISDAMRVLTNAFQE